MLVKYDGVKRKQTGREAGEQKYGFVTDKTNRNISWARERLVKEHRLYASVWR